MTVFKCKMCGGTLEFDAGTSVATCDSCGTKQTLPRLDDEKRAILYDRANHFRRNNEYDKAMGIYEQILAEDRDDAEAYWSLVLCRYGVEYVEDPTTHRRVPTVNRAQFTSVLMDADYNAALRCADSYQHGVYEAEAKALDGIQRSILAISQKEEPFDVFICYKDTDANGRRTPDSVLAGELYHQLTQEGFRVFFSRITLEDKLGQEYEPYIFAALNSARVMVVLGTKPEYFNAVWVKNEWSRYLALIKGGANKLLIPAYKDMDPYDLPDALSHLQAQDMAKLGFMQDLVRGIKKLAAPQPTTQSSSQAALHAAGSIAPLLRRAFMFLEDGEWQRADEFCEQVLNLDPENAMAYVGKLCAELQARTKEELNNCAMPFDDNGNYKKALRFGDIALQTVLTGAVEHIITRNEEERLNGLYLDARASMDAAADEVGFIAAAKRFRTVSGYRDADALLAACLEMAETIRKNEVYDAALNRMRMNTISELTCAKEKFESISGWKDADEQAATCQSMINDGTVMHTRRAAEKAKKKRKRMKCIWRTAPFAIILFLAAFSVFHTPVRYEYAKVLLENHQYTSAQKAFGRIEPYKDSQDYILEIQLLLALQDKEQEKVTDAKAKLRELALSESDSERAMKYRYLAAKELMSYGEYSDAEKGFIAIKGYEDSETLARESCYQRAIVQLQGGQFEEAVNSFGKLGDYSDSSEQLQGAEYLYAINLMEKGLFPDAIAKLEKLLTYNDSKLLLSQARYQYGCSLMEQENYKEAIAQFNKTDKQLHDPSIMLTQARYQYGCLLMKQEKFKDASEQLALIPGYADASVLRTECIYQRAILLFESDDIQVLNTASDFFRNLGDYKNSATYYNNYLYKTTLQVGEVTQLQLSRKVYEKYAGDIVINRITMERINEDTVRFQFYFNHHTRTETILFSTYVDNASNRLFHGKKNIRADETSVYFDVPITKVINATDIWARHFVGNNDLGKYRTDIDIQPINSIKRLLMNYLIEFVPLLD